MYYMSYPYISLHFMCYSHTTTAIQGMYVVPLLLFRPFTVCTLYMSYPYRYSIQYIIIYLLFKTLHYVIPLLLFNTVHHNLSAIQDITLCHTPTAIQDIVIPLPLFKILSYPYCYSRYCHTPTAIQDIVIPLPLFKILSYPYCYSRYDVIPLLLFKI